MPLAVLNLSTTLDALVYQVPANQRAIVSLNLCNRGASTVKVRVALTAGAVPDTFNWIEYDTPIPAAGSPDGSTLERTGLVLIAGDRLYVRADIVHHISAVVVGVVEPV